ncbi:MAG: hypothetical protein K2O44_01965 [Clostridia bacterium]|nr:hypothetical protein [Clostridia bacterium]
MRKVFIGFLAGILCILIFAISACGGDKNGTYYPTNEEMKTNLENNGYVVTLYQDLSDNDGKHHEGTLLFASKNREGKKEEYLYFYRFDNVTSCEYFYNSLENNCENYNSLVKIENDEKFGNIVYCGTENAVNSAGIKVVNVVVNV